MEDDLLKTVVVKYRSCGTNSIGAADFWTTAMVNLRKFAKNDGAIAFYD